MDIVIECIPSNDLFPVHFKRGPSSGSPFRFDEVYGNRKLALEGNSKFSLISKLQMHNDMNNSIFIDDAPNEFSHHDWEAVGVTTMVAGWGYNGLSDNTTEVLNTVEEWLNDFTN